MKYPFDKGFQKSMVNMPFRGFICKLTQKPMELMLRKVKCLRDEGLVYAEHIRSVAAFVEVNETKGTVHGYDTVTEHPIARESTKKRIVFMKKNAGI